jgi:transcriptional regulator with XRE-family HTH domain
MNSAVSESREVETSWSMVRRVQRPCRVIAPAVLGISMSFTALTAMPDSRGPDVLAAVQRCCADLGTRPATLVDWPVDAPLGDFAASVRGLYRRSGLTWNEIARALGVSRRAVHHWSEGKRPAESHAQRLEDLVRLVGLYELATPESTRGALLAPTSDGASALSHFAEASAPVRTVPLSTMRPADFFAADIVSQTSVRRPSRRSSLSSRPLPRPPESEET